MSGRRGCTLGLLALAVVTVSGCAVGPNYKPPKIEPPASFRFANAPADAASIVDLPWWQVFNDVALQALLRRALENNFDLRVAVARVEQSRALARAAGAKLLPGIGVTGVAAYASGSAAPGTLAAFAGSAVVSWEPDVFGGLRRGAEQAEASCFASVEARRNVWLMVLADVGQAYFRLLALDLQHDIAVRTIAARQQTLELYRTQLQGGVATGLQVARAEADVYSAQATLSNIEQQIGTGEDAISLLLGLAPGPVARPGPIETLPPPPVVPAGLPSSLLTRRPDIRQAEAQLVASNAQVGVATAALFPTFPLTAAPALTSIAGLPFASIKGWAYLLAGLANWTAPILQGSALISQVDAADAAKKAAIVTYQQTVFTAFREVADALLSLDKLRDERAHEEQEVASLARAVDISLSSFRGGTASYLDVVTAQENEFSAQLSLADLEGQQLAAFVQLYRTLGGGWWLAEPRSTVKVGVAPIQGG